MNRAIEGPRATVGVSSEERFAGPLENLHPLRVFIDERSHTSALGYDHPILRGLVLNGDVEGPFLTLFNVPSGEIAQRDRDCVPRRGTEGVSRNLLPAIPAEVAAREPHMRSDLGPDLEGARCCVGPDLNGLDLNLEFSALDIEHDPVQDVAAGAGSTLHVKGARGAVSQAVGGVLTCLADSVPAAVGDGRVRASGGRVAGVSSARITIITADLIVRAHSVGAGVFSAHVIVVAINWSEDTIAIDRARVGCAAVSIVTVIGKSTATSGCVIFHALNERSRVHHASTQFAHKLRV